MLLYNIFKAVSKTCEVIIFIYLSFDCLDFLRLRRNQLNNCEWVLVYLFVWMHNGSFKLRTKNDCWIQRIVLIIKNYRNDSKWLWRWQWRWYWDQFFHSISWVTVGLTHRNYWCSSTYMTMTLTLLNIDCLEFDWLFFPWLIFLDESKTRKLQIVWLSYRIISGNLSSSGIKFLNPHILSLQKSYKNVQEAINECFTLAKLKFFSFVSDIVEPF